MPFGGDIKGGSFLRVEGDAGGDVFIQLLPLLSGIAGAPHAGAGAGKEQILVVRVLGNDIGAAVGAGDPLYPPPGGARVQGAIDATAGTGEDPAGKQGVHCDGEDVGIIKHARGDFGPGAPAVECFPGEVRCASVEDARFIRVKGDGNNRGEIGVALWADATPGVGPVVRHPDPIVGASSENIFIFGPGGESKEGEVLGTGHGLPGFALIEGSPETTGCSANEPNGTGIVEDESGIETRIGKLREVC